MVRHPVTRVTGVRAALAAAILAGSTIAPRLGHAQPAPELDRAKDLYQAAETEMRDGQFEAATRDYGAAYDLSKDPALFFKIGHANEKAGKCEVALIYFARYLREGKPSEQFIASTKQHIAACGGDRGATPVQPAVTTGQPAAEAAPKPAPAASPPPPPPPPPAAAPEAATSPPPSPSLAPSNRHKVAWILTGTGIALVALGGVLAYATTSSESDIRDLYVGFAGQPTPYDAKTQQRYRDLIDQGHRYQHLSWASFGLAGAAAVSAALLFTLGGEAEPAQHARITPIVSTTGAGIALTF